MSKKLRQRRWRRRRRRWVIRLVNLAPWIAILSIIKMVTVLCSIRIIGRPGHGILLVLSLWLHYRLIIRNRQY